jgi:threonine/homoserine/homoserine lactone efflux protein
MLGNMHSLPILTVASLRLVATVTPGPNSVLVMRVSVGQPRAQGLRAVIGIGTGTCVWGLSGFFGVYALFRAAPFLYWAFRLCGGVYFVLFGLGLIWTSLRRDGATADPEVKRSGWGPFRLGLATSLSNPKSALSVAGLFAATMPGQAPFGLGLTTVALMVTISAGLVRVHGLALHRPMDRSDLSPRFAAGWIASPARSSSSSAPAWFSTADPAGRDGRRQAAVKRRRASGI